MTVKEVKALLAIYQLDAEFKKLTGYKRELACLKSLIRALGYRTENPEFAVLHEEMSRVVLNSVITGRIQLAQKAEAKENNMIVSTVITDIGMRIRVLSEKIEQLMGAVASTYISKEVTEIPFTLINEVIKLVHNVRDELKKANVLLDKCDDILPEEMETA